MKRIPSHLLITCASALLLVACGDDDGGSNTNQNQSAITVTITSPASQSYVGSTVQVTGEVTGEVTQVALVVDEAIVAQATTAPWVLEWDASAASEAMHTLRLRATGVQGEVVSSADVLVIVDRTAPTLALPQLALPYVFAGTVQLTADAFDDNELAEVRLLVNGDLEATATTTPYTLPWDTTVLEDGPFTITVEAEDVAGNVASLAVPVMVVNDGTLVVLDEGATARFFVPTNYSEVDIDKKAHWTMPAGITRILAALQWDRPEWQLDLAVGTGYCPHSGEVLGDRVADVGGQLTVDLTPEGTAFGEEMHFIHLGPGANLDLAACVGLDTNAAFVVALY
jgi:hypothetical protein